MNKIYLFILFIFIFSFLNGAAFAKAPLVTGISEKNPLKICTIGNFNLGILGLDFVSSATAKCLFSSVPAGVNVLTAVTFVNSTYVECLVPDRVGAGLSINVLLSVSNDGVEFSGQLEMAYSGKYAWAGNIFLTGHDPDFHAYVGSGNGGPFWVKSLDFTTKYTWNNLAAPDRKKFLFVEAKTAATGTDVKHSLNTLTYYNLTVGVHFDHVDAAEFANVALSNYSALVIASAGGGMLTTREIRALNARKTDIEYFLKQGGGLAAYAQGIGSFTVTKNIAGITDCAVSEAFAFLPITVAGSPNIVLPYKPTPLGVSKWNITELEINDPSHSIFAQTGGLDILTYDSKNQIVTLAGQINACPNDCNGKGSCTCGECFCANGYHGKYCECDPSIDDCDTCGDGILSGEEQCDKGIGCLPDCSGCATGYTVTEPLSPFCQAILYPRVATITTAPTSGGIVTVTGTNLGVDAGAIVMNIAGEKCTSPSFTDATKSKFTCLAPAGTGISNVITIASSGRQGDGLGHPFFKYLPPTFTSADSIFTDGGSISIKGTNFGDELANVNVSIGSGSCQVTETKHTYLICTVLPGSGTGHSVSVNVATQTTTGTFSYKAPQIDSITDVGTKGGDITIIGKSFGVDSTSKSVTYEGTNICLNPRVILDHKILVCTVSQGTGEVNSIFVTISSQNSNVDSFSYNSPTFSHKFQPIPTLGATITIGGDNFGNNQSLISVTVGGKSCSNLHLLTNHVLLECDVPAGTGPQSLFITVDGQNSLTEMIGRLPAIVSSTNTIPTNGGIVTIDGSNFGTNKAVSSVAIGNKLCVISTVSESQIICTLPFGTGHRDVQVTIDTITSSTSNVFSYDAPVYSASSKSQTQGQTTITVTGTNFGDNSSLVSVSINENYCQSVQILTAHSKLSCIAPKGTGQNNSLLITVDSISSDEIDNYTYQSPIVTSSTPTPTRGGITTLSGSNFGENSELVQVIISDFCTNVVITQNHTKLTCLVIPGTGTENLQIDVDTLTNSNTFKYQAPIFVDELPQVPTTGGEITIGGDNFGTTQDHISVTVGGKPCTNLTLLEDHVSISCVVSEGTGSQSIIITVDGLNSTTETITRQSSTISLASSVPTTGGVVSITGTGFGDNQDIVSIEIGEEVCEIQSLSDTSISCLLPKGTGVQTIKVSVDGIQSIIPNRFTYEAPVVNESSKSPTQGQSTITITGSNFGDDSSLVSVSIGGNECDSVELLTAHKELSCISPKGTGSSRLVVTVNSLQNENTNYTYESPVVSSSTHTPTRGGLTTITGLNFGEDSSLVFVHIAGSECTDVILTQNHTELTCTAPQGTGLEVVEVEVDTLSESYDSIHQYDSPNVDTSSIIPTKGGMITITGNNFGNDFSLIKAFVNGVQCYSLQVVTDHEKIQCYATYGQGVNNPVYVIVDNQTSPTASVVSYDIPKVKSTSGSVTSTNSGKVTVFGDNFGSISSDILVTIDGDKNCTDVKLLLNHESLICTLQPGSGFQLNVNVTVSGQSSLPNKLFNYDDGAKCDDPTCGGNGVCVGGICSCRVPYNGPTCSSVTPDTGITPGTSTSGTTSTGAGSTSGLVIITGDAVTGAGSFEDSNEDGVPDKPTIQPNTTLPDITIRLPTNETINIFVKEVREYSALGEQLLSYPVSTMKWNLTSVSSNESMKWKYNITLENNALLAVEITYFFLPSVVEFAGQSISMPNGNVKFNIDIYNWTYIEMSKINNVKVIMTAQVVGTPNNCNEDQIGLDSNQDNDQLHWFQFNQNGHSLYGRFSNRGVTDDRIVPVSQAIDRKSSDGREIDVSISVPHFERETHIDPDFSVLLGTNSVVTQCEKGVKWQTVVGSVIGSVAGAAMMIGGVLYFRRKKEDDKFKKTLNSIGKA